MRQVRPSRLASVFSFSTLRLNLVLTRGISPPFRDGVHLFISSTSIGSVPSLSGHATAYGWRSQSRIRCHRASSPQDIPSVTGVAFFSGIESFNEWGGGGCCKFVTGLEEDGKEIAPARDTFDQLPFERSSIRSKLANQVEDHVILSPCYQF